MPKGWLTALSALLALAIVLLGLTADAPGGKGDPSMRPVARARAGSDASDRMSPGARVAPASSEARRQESGVEERADGARSTAGPDGHHPQPPVPNGVLTVTVVDTAGSPIPGARVRLTPTGPPKPHVEQGREVVQAWSERRHRLRAAWASTDETGTAVLRRLPWIQLEAIASSEGLAPGRSDRIELSQDHPEARAEITLAEGGCISGTMLDVEGGPVDGVEVTARLRVLGLRGEVDRIDLTATAADGSFSFRDLEAGTWLLKTGSRRPPHDQEPPRYPPQRVRVEVRAGETTHVSLPTAGVQVVDVAGHVRRDGAPLAQALVSASLARPFHGSDTISRTTDSQGRFEMVLVAGEWVFGVYAGAGQGGWDQAIRIPETAGHDVVLESSTGSLSGTVLGPRGEGVGWIDVIAWWGRPWERPAGSFGWGRASVDAHGRYRIAALPAGSYIIEAFPIGAGANPFWGAGQSPRITISPGQVLEGVDVQLSSCGSIQGRVANAGGRAIPWASIVLVKSGRNQDIMSDAAGRYAIPGVDPGAYWVRGTQDGRTSPWTEAWVSAGTVTLVDPVLSAGATVRVELVDTIGSVDLGVVRLEPEGGRPAITEVIHVGWGVARGVPPGTYRVVAQRGWPASEGADVTTEIKVLGGDEQVVRLRLP